MGHCCSVWLPVVLGAMCQGSLRLAGEGGAPVPGAPGPGGGVGPVSPDRVIVLGTLDGGPVGQQTLSKDLGRKAVAQPGG